MISSKRSIDRSISKTPFFFFFFFWFLVFGWALFLLLSSFDGERVFSFEDTFKEERALLLLFFLFLLRKRLSSDLPSKRVWSKECEKERKREREQRGRRRKNHTQSCLLWVKRIRFKERERKGKKKCWRVVSRTDSSPRRCVHQHRPMTERERDRKRRGR